LEHHAAAAAISVGVASAVAAKSPGKIMHA